MSEYRCVSTNKKYSEEQMRDLFKFKEYKGYTGTFEEWIKEEIDSGYIKIIESNPALEKANDNIIQLIDMIIGYEESDTRNNCPKPRSYGKYDCPHDENGNKVSCGECKEIYLFHNISKNMDGVLIICIIMIVKLEEHMKQSLMKELIIRSLLNGN